MIDIKKDMDAISKRLDKHYQAKLMILSSILQKTNTKILLEADAIIKGRIEALLNEPTVTKPEFKRRVEWWLSKSDEVNKLMDNEINKEEPQTTITFHQGSHKVDITDSKGTHTMTFQDFLQDEM